MSEENLTSNEILAENPEIQAYVDEVSGKVAEESFAKFEASKEPVEIPEPVQAPKPAPVELKPLKQEPKYAAPIPVTIEDIEKSIPQASGPAVVSNNTVDYVRLAAIIFKNIHARKSLSVHHMQRRLNELGYVEAFADRDGYYGDKTREALGRFQGDNNLVGGGLVNKETLELLFLGDPNVDLVD